MKSALSARYRTLWSLHEDIIIDAPLPGGVPTRHKHKYRTAYTRGIYWLLSRIHSTQTHTNTNKRTARSPSKYGAGLISYRHWTSQLRYHTQERAATKTAISYHSLCRRAAWALLPVGCPSGPCWVQAWSVVHQSNLASMLKVLVNDAQPACSKFSSTMPVLRKTVARSTGLLWVYRRGTAYFRGYRGYRENCRIIQHNF